MPEVISIPKIYTVGTRFNYEVLQGAVVIEEKYDGSQFTFMLQGGQLFCRSKSTQINLEDPGMFAPAVEAAKQRVPLMEEGHLFCCEFLARERHNVLKYGRPPQGFLVLYDVRCPDGQWLSPSQKGMAAFAMCIEPVRVLHIGEFTGCLDNLLGQESSLGGAKMEGIVIKNYAKSHPDREGWPMTAKLVAAEFKEKQSSGHPVNPKAGPGEFIQSLINSLRTEPRWIKAINHLRESGQLKNEPQDIGPLVREIQSDIKAEESDWIKQQLFDQFWSEISKGAIQGFALWYKNHVLADGLSVFQETQIK
jgi:hypothetical protein